MKQLLVIAVALASVNAFATRARVSSLANSPHLIDTQTVYSNPADMFFVGGDYANLETGATTSTTVGTYPSPTSQVGDGAEGMVVRSFGDSKAGLSLGHDSNNAINLRSIAGITAAVSPNISQQQNPIELSYGMKAGEMAWAGTLVYSNFKDKNGTGMKEDTMGLRGGIRMGALDARLSLGLANNAQSNDATVATGANFKGTTGIGAGVGYWMDTLYFAADINMAGFKYEISNGAGAFFENKKYDATTYGVSVTNSVKKDGNEFFYGAGLTKADQKLSTTATQGAVTSDLKVSALVLPVWMGLEVDAASWLTLRGSLTQRVLINDTKAENNPGGGGATTTLVDYSPGLNNTAVAVGAGLKFNKITLDGTLEGMTGGQKLNANALLATAGLTYMF